MPRDVRHYFVVILVTVAGWLGIPALSPVSSRAYADSPRIDLQVIARVRDASGAHDRVLRSGEVLHSGDQVQVRIKTTQSANIYVVIFGSTASASLLHPGAGEHSDPYLEAGVERIVPGPGQYLILDDNVGWERFFAFSAPEGVEEVSSLLVRMEGHGNDLDSVANEVRDRYPIFVAAQFEHHPPMSGIELSGDMATSNSPAEVSADVETGTIAGTVPATPPAAATALGSAAGVPVEADQGSSRAEINEAERNNVGAEDDSEDTASSEESISNVVVIESAEAGQEGGQASAFVPEARELGGSSPSILTVVPLAHDETSGLSKDERELSAQTHNVAEMPSTDVSSPVLGDVGTKIARLLSGVGLSESVSSTSPEPLEASVETPAQPMDLLPGRAASPLASEPKESLGEKLKGWLTLGRGSTEPATVPAGSRDVEVAEVAEVAEMAELRSAVDEHSATPYPLATDVQGEETADAETIDGRFEANVVVLPVLTGYSGGEAESVSAIDVSGALSSGGVSDKEGASLDTQSVEPPSKVVVIDSGSDSGHDGHGEAAADYASNASLVEHVTSQVSEQTHGNSEVSLAGTSTQTGPPSVEETPEAESRGRLGKWLKTVFAVSHDDRGETANGRELGIVSSPSGEGPASTLVAVEANDSLSVEEAEFSTLGGATSRTGEGAVNVDEATLGESGESSKPSPMSLETSAGVEPDALGKDAQASASESKLWGALSSLFRRDEPNTEVAKLPSADSNAVVAETAGLSTPVPGEAEASRVGLVTAKEGPVRLAGTERTLVTDTRVLGGEGRKISRLLDGEPAGLDEAEAGLLAARSADAAATMGAVSAPIEGGDSIGVAEPAATDLQLTAAVPSVPEASPIPFVEPEIGALDLTAELLDVAIDVNSPDDVSSSVVLVVTPGLSGSGVLVHAEGLVLTNWHIIKDHVHASVFFKSETGNEPDLERGYIATVLKVNRFSDLALLKIENPPKDLQPVAIAGIGEFQVPPGERIHAIGHPQGVAWAHTVVTVSKVRDAATWYSGHEIAHRGSLLQGEVPADPGSSGAPLFNQSLHLVGISSALGRRPGLLNAVDLNAILRFLDAGASAHVVVSGS